MERQYAALRDTARPRHGRFRLRDLRRLRSSLLTSSLDLANLARDADADPGSRRVDGDARFYVAYAPRTRRALHESGRSVPEPVNLNEDLRERQRHSLSRLVATDRDYRDILATVASLGTSIATTRAGRLAILIAAVSLAVVVVAVVTA
jgi:hypothetical protein